MSGSGYNGYQSNQCDAKSWGQEIIAALSDMGSCQALGSPADPQAMVISHTLQIGDGIHVNTKDKQFDDKLEDISGQSQTIVNQPGSMCWVVYDKRLHEDRLMRFQNYRDAMEELAEKISVPVHVQNRST